MYLCMCNKIVKAGKNKGKKCSKKVAYDSHCTIHNKMEIDKSSTEVTEEMLIKMILKEIKKSM